MGGGDDDDDDEGGRRRQRMVGTASAKTLGMLRRRGRGTKVGRRISMFKRRPAPRSASRESSIHVRSRESGQEMTFRRGELVAMAVDPELQGKGISTPLLEMNLEER